MTFTAVLFDLDGTLSDSQAGIIASYHYALHAFDLQAADGEIRALIGPPLQQNLSVLGVPPRHLEAAIEVYRDYYSRKGMYDSKLFGGIPEVLATLSAAGISIGLATSKMVDYAGDILEHFRISQYFNAVSGATRDGRRLHKSEVVEDALEALGLPAPAGVAMVGDRENDMWAARDFGLYGVGALWGYGTKEELVAAGAKVLAATPEELVPLLLP